MSFKPEILDFIDEAVRFISNKKEKWIEKITTNDRIELDLIPQAKVIFFEAWKLFSLSKLQIYRRNQLRTTKGTYIAFPIFSN